MMIIQHTNFKLVILGLVYILKPISFKSEFCTVVAELKPVTATQSSLWRNDANKFGAGNCIDGDEGSDKRGGRYVICHTNTERAPWIAIDYGTSVAVERVDIFNRGDCCGQRTRNVEVWISNTLPTSGSRRFSGGTVLGRFAGPASNGQHITISGQKLL